MEPKKVRSFVVNQWVFPVLSYAAQPWSFTKGMMDKLNKMQRLMDRPILNSKLIDPIRNQDIRQKNKFINVRQHASSLNWGSNQTTSGRDPTVNTLLGKRK